MQEKLCRREWWVIFFLSSFIFTMGVVAQVKRRSLQGLMRHYQSLERVRSTSFPLEKKHFIKSL